MRALSFFGLAILMIAISGCTEMRVEGDAKIFQSSAIGSLIRIIVGIGLIGLGGVAIAAGVLPDKKPKKRTAKPQERLSSGQRVGMIIFGGGMGFAGLCLIGISLLFPNKLHVTVYPDRVEMASTYSQTGGKELVIPFSSLASVELRDERNIVGKLKPYLFFTQKNGNVIKQEAGNNERKAVDTIKNALAAFSGSSPEKAAPAASGGTPVVTGSSPDTSSVGSTGSPGIEMPKQEVQGSAPLPSAGFPPMASSSPPNDNASPKTEQYSLKRYEITIPVPAGYSIVGPDTVVEVGRKLKACYANSWSTVTVVAVNSDGTLSCNWDSYPAFTYKMMREDLTIGSRDENPPMAGNPNAGDGSGNPAPSVPPAKEYTLKRYPVTIPVPRGYSLVDAKSEVKVGMKLGACYASRWEPVTVVAINDDGTITCNWDNYPGFIYKMMREDLAMKKR